MRRSRSCSSRWPPTASSTADRGASTRPGRCRPSPCIEVTGTDRDGELIADPVEWDSANAGKPPRILIASRRAQGTRSELQPPAKGDRLLAKI